jgi:hypothetical protein
LSVTLAFRALSLSLPISTTWSAEALATKKAVSGFGELRHKTCDRPERRTARTTNLDPNGVEVYGPTFAGDNTPHVADRLRCTEFNAQDLGEF